MNEDTADCIGNCCGIGCAPVCLHEDLKYNLCCNTVTCQTCGAKWDAHYEFTYWPPYFIQ